ncbi:GNAT family N-acetyltransferase [uncultured Algimonas sp.]|uniref:GNAT family N-acetyltransferase n=1 Tax=uncultured Algimonas sp. TaxID=1547920 RepID=UPI00260E1778|nr:GNAT family N-acetyltransferase [uncultured Algimonas sp.]
MAEILHLRPALPSDADTLRRWDARDHVADASGDPDFNATDWDAELARTADWQDHRIAMLGARQIGMVQMIDAAREESHYWGDVADSVWAIDIWIGEPDCIGQGHGREMMRQALDLCFARPGVGEVRVDPLASNTSAHRFYDAMGFTFTGPRQFGPDHCHVYAITRYAWRKGNDNA